MKKRILSLFLVLLMVLGILPTALASENEVAPIADYGKVYVTSNVEDAMWTNNGSENISGITDKPVIYMRTFTTSGTLSGTLAPVIKILNYTQITESYVLDYISFDGHRVLLTDLTTTQTEIDTSGWTDSSLQGKTIKVFLNNNCPQVNFAKNELGTLESDVNIVIQFKQVKADKSNLIVTAGEHGSFEETKYIDANEDGSHVYKVYAKPDEGYQLSSYTVKGTETPVSLDLTSSNYRWIESDNFFNITILEDTEITLNFTPATVELEFWSHVTTSNTENAWNVDMFGRVFESDGTDSWKAVFEENKISIPLIDDLGARFFFKVNVKGFKEYGVEGENCQIKLYSGTEAVADHLLFDSTEKEYKVNNTPTVGNHLRGDRCGGIQVFLASIPSDLTSIYVELDYAGYKFTGTYPVQLAKNLDEVKEFISYYTEIYGLDKQGIAAYTEEEKQTEGYKKYCQYANFRYVLRLAYNEYLTKIASEPDEQARKELLEEGKQALDDAAVGKDCNAVVWSFLEKDGVKAIPVMVAVPNDVEDYSQHPSAGTTAHIAMIAALEALYPGNWTYTFHVTQFGSFVNKISAGGEDDIGQTVVSTEDGSTGANYGFWFYNGEFSDWGVSNYNPYDGDVMYWGGGDVEKNWCWAKLRLFYGSDEALEQVLEERGETKSISAMTAKELQQTFSDLEDGSGKEFFRRYGQFREVEAYETATRLINQIGTVTPDSGEKIEAARKAYDQLTEEEKAKIINYQTLLDAEEAYAAITGPSGVEATEAEENVLKTLNNGRQLTVGSQFGEWAVLALARGGKDLSGQAEGYLQAVEQALNDGTLTLATDYARVTLALTAMGIDAPEKLLSGCADFELVKKQGINAAAYCLLALNAKPYGENYDEVRETYVAYLLAKALPTGGWIYGVGTTCDVDMSAMVLQSLAPYADREDVAQAIDDALEALKLQQKPTGGFATFGSYNAESTAQMIVALTALGIDPTTWNGLNAVEALLHFYLAEDGKFAHTLGGAANQMATEQSVYALVAYGRYAAEKNSLYDMADADTTGALQQVNSVRFALLFDGMTVTTDMETANTAEDAAKLVEDALNALGYSGNAYSVSIEDGDFTAAVAGTAQNKSGEDGSFTASVTVTNGTKTANGLRVSGTITATAYVAPTQPTQPSAPVAPTVKPTVSATSPFGDVTKGEWYYDAVLYVYKNGLMNGTGNGAFSPNANTTRGMIVTILARQEGADTAQSGLWYEVGRQWAMENGISDGTDMDGQITREQLAAMMYRYAKFKGYDTEKFASLAGFADGKQVSDWAKNAMQWAVAEGLMQGSDNQLTPAAPATRAQVAAILMRFLEKYN